MSEESLRKVCLHALLVVVLGFLAGVAAASFEARGMLPTGVDMNTFVMLIFSVGFVGTVISFWIALGALSRRRVRAQCRPSR